MPQPSSSTVMITESAVIAVATMICPFTAEYFIALSIIFINTCLIRFLSPKIVTISCGSSYRSVLFSCLAFSEYIITASVSSANTSIFALLRLNLPPCILEKSSSSSTILESLSDSSAMTRIPFLAVSLSLGLAAIVSLQPFIAVSGVRSSCDTEEMKSFFIFSEFSSSSAI